MKPTMRTRPAPTGQPKHCHAAARRKKADQENRLYNAKIRKALEGIYRKKASRLHEHGVEGRNVVDAFAARTALYDDDRAEAKPQRREAWTGATDRDPARDQMTSKGRRERDEHDRWEGRVGSAVALAQCNACGLRSFYGSDGAPMRPCHLCGVVFYCDRTCCAVDAPAHALTCQNARGRKRWPTKLAAFWVQSRATTVAQKLLRRRPKPSVEEVMRAMAKARAEDAAVDEAEAKKGPPPMAAKVSSRLGDSGAPPPETAARTAARLAEDDERDAAAKRIRERRKLAEGLRDRETSRVATVGALEDDLRRLEARALEVALERRSVLLQMHASSARDDALASLPKRTGRGVGRAREVRVNAERAALERTPKPTSAAIGDFRMHSKVVAKPPPGRSMRESTFSSGTRASTWMSLNPVLVRERPVGDDGEHDVARERRAPGDHAQAGVLVLPRARRPSAQIGGGRRPLVDDADHVVVEFPVGRRDVLRLQDFRYRAGAEQSEGRIPAIVADGDFQRRQTIIVFRFEVRAALNEKLYNGLESRSTSDV